VNILVGTTGFSYPVWAGIVYPPDMKKRKIHPLEYLPRFFDCCEINTSFYGHIRPNVGKEWRAYLTSVLLPPPSSTPPSRSLLGPLTPQTKGITTGLTKEQPAG